jgi:hypothetical protein
MRAAMPQLNLSARTYPRILKLARTIADLCAKELDPTIWSVRFHNNFSFKVEQRAVLRGIYLIYRYKFRPTALHTTG